VGININAISKVSLDVSLAIVFRLWPFDRSWVHLVLYVGDHDSLLYKVCEFDDLSKEGG